MTLNGSICIMDMTSKITYTITQVKNDFSKYAVTNDQSTTVLVYDYLVQAIEETEKFAK
jgi:hypothetical protein